MDEKVGNTEEQANRDSEKINRWKFWKQKRNPQGIKFRNTVECMTNSHNQAGKKDSKGWRTRLMKYYNQSSITRSK